jgi:hypothetical protein
MSFDSTAAETASTNSTFDFMDGWFNSASSIPTNLSWMFRRAPEFFDVVAYTGDGVAGRTVPHNLGVAPEMMIVKRRSGDPVDWAVYHSFTGATKRGRLNTNDLFDVSSTHWNNTSPTESVFTLGAATNTSSQTFIAYLFATLAGISKVGSYTGNGSSQTINCGFTTGARFILIKCTDGLGNWILLDTLRGISAGLEEASYLNTTENEATADWVDPSGSGFIAANNTVNGSGQSYIFYAIA